jgi:hypothetical protein
MRPGPAPLAFGLIGLVLFLGYRPANASDWVVTPRLDLGAKYDSDLSFSYVNRQHDFIFPVSPSVDFTNASEISKLNGRLALDGLAYVKLEARISEGMEESQKAEKFTIIDPAGYPEKPVPPKRDLIALAGLILGLGAGVGMVALTEGLDHAVKNTDILAWVTGLPVLGKIARIVTPEDIARKKQRRCLVWSLEGLLVFAGIIIVHFLIMDLWILFAKLGRLAAKHL